MSKSFEQEKISKTLRNLLFLVIKNCNKLLAFCSIVSLQAIFFCHFEMNYVMFYVFRSPLWPCQASNIFLYICYLFLEMADNNDNSTSSLSGIRSQTRKERLQLFKTKMETLIHYIKTRQSFGDKTERKRHRKLQ